MVQCPRRLRTIDYPFLPRYLIPLASAGDKASHFARHTSHWSIYSNSRPAATRSSHALFRAGRSLGTRTEQTETTKRMICLRARLWFRPASVQIGKSRQLMLASASAPTRHLLPARRRIMHFLVLVMHNSVSRHAPNKKKAVLPTAVTTCSSRADRRRYARRAWLRTRRKSYPLESASCPDLPLGKRCDASVVYVLRRTMCLGIL